jgi:hypothetical protein
MDGVYGIEERMLGRGGGGRGNGREVGDVYFLAGPPWHKTVPAGDTGGLAKEEGGVWQVGSFLENVDYIICSSVCQIDFLEVILYLTDASPESLVVVCYPFGEGVVDEDDVIKSY